MARVAAGLDLEVAEIGAGALGVLADELDARAEEAMERFELADLNDDGFLTEKEIKRALFDTIDSNGDSYIDAVELGDARRSRGQGRTG